MISETDIGDYEIIKGGVLGTGAFATVWKGRLKSNATHLVAIKAIKKKNFLKSQQLLSKEITILKELSSLHHKNVVGLLDCVELKDDVCLVMEYCNGGDLADCLHRNGTLSEDTLCSYVKQIAEAMKALQQKGIVHRDLKPQNILLCYEGNKYPHPSEMLLKIADFGFARFIIGAEMATTLCGSPMYMAPEVIMSVKYSAKADLWSIGTILYQCLTGRAPFQAQNPQELKKKYEKSPGLKPNIPANTSPELRDLLMRMLKRDAEERISFEEFFSHPFLQLPSPTPGKAPVSAPVAVPKRRSSSTSEAGSHGRSPKKTSPSRTKKSPTPTNSPKVQEVKEEDMVTTLTEASGFTKVEKEDLKDMKAKSGRTTPEEYVMVPEALCLDSDGEGEESVCVRKAPLAEEEMSSISDVTYKDKEKDPTGTKGCRPVTLPMDSQPPQSQPICVQAGNHPTCSPGYTGSDSKHKVKSPDVKMESDSQGAAFTRQNSESRSSGVDNINAGSFTPPAVQFCVGTPPSLSSGLSWRRSNVVTPPPSTLSGSPHRKSSMSSQHFSPLQLSNTSTSLADSHPSSLPTVMVSPDKISHVFPLRSPHDNSPEPIHAPFAAAASAFHNSNTVPDNMAAMARQREVLADIQPMECHHIGSEPSHFTHQGHGRNRQVAAVVAVGYGESRDKMSYADGDHKRHICPDQDNAPLNRFNCNQGAPQSPHPHSPKTTSFQMHSPKNSSPLRFVSQPLLEETLMDDNHNETLGKLSFVLDLVECILDLARSLGSAFRSVDPVETKKVEHLSPEHYSQYRTSQRSLEQLVLYARACSLLNSALHLAREETRNDRLHQSTSLCNVITELQTYYHHVVDKCKTIHRDFTHNCKTPLSPKLVMATADKLIYNQAVHMCQTAALDEFSSNCTPDLKSEVVRRYQVAQILFHSLAQTAHNENDKFILMKYLKNVERRLLVLTCDGVQCEGHDLHQQSVDNQRFQCQS